MALSREEKLARQRAYNRSPAGRAATARYLAKPEKRALKNAISAEWQRANPERARAAHRRNRGVQAATGERRSGACDICNRERRLFLDHDHATGAARGWLCATCNSFIGQTQADAVARAQRVLEYVNP